VTAWRNLHDIYKDGVNNLAPDSVIGIGIQVMRSVHKDSGALPASVQLSKNINQLFLSII